MTTTYDPIPLDDDPDAVRLAGAFPAGYASPATRRAYRVDLRYWFAFCRRHRIHPYRGIRRTHLELYLRELEQLTPKPANTTRYRRVATLSAWFGWLEDEPWLGRPRRQDLEHLRGVTRPRLPAVAACSMRGDGDGARRQPPAWADGSCCDRRVKTGGVVAGDQQFTGQMPDEPYRVLRALAGPRAVVRRHLPLAWRRRLAILVGGCVGSGLRIAVGTVPVDPAGWPWATLIVNLTGALLLGYLLVRFQQAAISTALTIPLLCVGVLGSYTTFSALSAETWQLVARGETGMAAGYAAASLFGGLLAALGGIRLAERRP